MVKYFTTDELQLLFSVIDDREKKIVFQMALELGCRVSEICNLPRSRITTDYVKILDEKKDIFRDCIISKELANEIENWYWDNQKIGMRPGPRQFFYRSSRTLNNWLKEYCQKANIPLNKAHMHTFRHTFIVMAWAKNWNPKSICDQTGDSLQTLVKVYSHLSPEGRREQWKTKPLFKNIGSGVMISNTIQKN